MKTGLFWQFLKENIDVNEVFGCSCVHLFQIFLCLVLLIFLFNKTPHGGSCGFYVVHGRGHQNFLENLIGAEIVVKILQKKGDPFRLKRFPTIGPGIENPAHWLGAELCPFAGVNCFHEDFQKVLPKKSVAKCKMKRNQEAFKS